MPGGGFLRGGKTVNMTEKFGEGFTAEATYGTESLKVRMTLTSRRREARAQSPSFLDHQILGRWGQLYFALRTCLVLAIIT